MKISAVREAISEAERFIKRAKMLKEDQYLRGETPWGALSASCKRSSLDLSKALAKMRAS